MTEEDFKRKAEETLPPQFIAACGAESDTVSMAQGAWGYSETELLGIAIKYAGLCGKIVHIVPDAPVDS